VATVNLRIEFLKALRTYGHAALKELDEWVMPSLEGLDEGTALDAVTIPEVLLAVPTFRDLVLRPVSCALPPAFASQH
jgi:hypothetical protein